MANNTNALLLLAIIALIVFAPQLGLGGSIIPPINPPELPIQPTLTCADYNLANEYTRYFGITNIQAIQTACISNGGQWVFTNNQVSCHWTSATNIDCNQQAVLTSAQFCNSLKATHICSNTAKFVGCLCNLNPPTQPLDGNQPQEYTCGWHSYTTGNLCTGTCPSDKECRIYDGDCGCFLTSTLHGNGQIGDIFTTSIKWNGAMGGIAGADAKCQLWADYGGYSGTWKAIMSDDTTNAINRLDDIPYYRIDGVKVANSRADLLDGSILAPLNVDENKNTVSGGVWTGTSANGIGTGTYCHNWGWVDATGTAGISTSTGSEWTNVMADDCHVSKSIYCTRVI